MDNKNKDLVNELTRLLLGGTAHASLKKALKGLPAELRGAKPDKMPYSIWQLVEHIRIAQWDMLNFCLDPNHKSPKWPDEYWPQDAAPQNDAAWDESIEQINKDMDEFIGHLEHSDLYEKLPGGNGQTVLLEALQLADHNAYHIAEIVVIRRLLGAWD
ncbi:MAG: DinB family protein [Mucilaginibacter sp.]